MGQGEFELIDQRLKPLSSGFDGALNLSDDAALLSCPTGEELVLAKDAIVENVHFLADDPPASIAQKLLRTNLSDLAAMAARPLAYLTALFLPAHISDRWIAEFTSGLSADQQEFGLHLIGGDITSTPGPLSMSCTIIGAVPKGQAILRQGARAGDDVWVSGHLGDAALGLRILQGLAADEETALILQDRYRRPRPRLSLGLALRGIATSMIDVSDGLLADLDHILDCSKVGAVIEVEALPLSGPARDVPGAREAALTGGDDYELLFTADPDNRQDLLEISRTLGLPITKIGQITDDQIDSSQMSGSRGALVRGGDGQPYTVGRTGWRHR